MISSKRNMFFPRTQHNMQIISHMKMYGCGSGISIKDEVKGVIVTILDNLCH